MTNNIDFIIDAIDIANGSLISVFGNCGSGKSALAKLITQRISNKNKKVLYFSESNFKNFAASLERVSTINGQNNNIYSNITYKGSTSYLINLKIIDKLIKYHKSDFVILDFNIVNMIIDEYSNIPRTLLIEKKINLQSYVNYSSYQKRIILYEDLREISMKNKINILICETTATIPIESNYRGRFSPENFFHSHIFDLILFIEKSTKNENIINPLTKNILHKCGHSSVEIMKNRFGPDNKVFEIKI